MAARQPNHRKLWFFINTLRTVFVILLYTMVSWLMVRHSRENPPISIIGNVPRGFQHMHVPYVDADLAGIMAPDYPVSVIVMLMYVSEAHDCVYSRADFIRFQRAHCHLKVFW